MLRPGQPVCQPLISVLVLKLKETSMATFDQRGRVVDTQYNADSITIHPQTMPPSMRERTGPPPVDVVLITPLEEERDAVLAQLAGARQLPPTQDDIRVYYAAELPVTFLDGAAATYQVVIVTH
jgi:hypothetical protein